jgi:hypothetical protein
MSVEKPLEKSIRGAFEAIFEALPPLDSPQFIDYLRTASAADLPAQVVARAYRQLCTAGREEAAQATVTRLVGSEYKYHYLASVRRLAKHSIGMRCKDYFRARKCFEHLSLCGEPEQTLDELRLSLCITSR